MTVVDIPNHMQELVRSGAFLLGIILLKSKDWDKPTAVEFLFEGNSPLILEVNGDEDSLQWSNKRAEDLFEMSSLNEIEKFQESTVLRCWEMVNQQGYFDSFQIELWNKVNAQEKILQFYAAGSSLKVYECTPLIDRITDGHRPPLH